MQTNHKKGMLLTLLGVLIITPDTLMIRLIDINFWSINVWRGLLGGIIVLLILVISNPKKIINDFKKYSFYDVLASIAFGLGSISFVYAVNHTWVANVLLLFSSAPIFAVIFSYFFLKHKTNNATLIAICCCFTGMLVIVSGHYSNDSMLTQLNIRSTFWGDLVAVTSAALFALSLTLSRGGKQINIPLNYAIGSILSGLFSLMFAPILFNFTFDQWILLLTMSLVIIPLSYNLILYGSSLTHTAQATLLIQIESIIGPFWVWLVIKEFPGNNTLIGGVIIIASLLILNIYQLRKQSKV